MAYETGVFGGSDDLTDIHALLETAAASYGWTKNYGTYPYLGLSVNQCFVNLYFDTAQTQNDIFGSTASAASPDHNIRGHLSSAYNSAPGTDALKYLGQTNSQVSTLADADHVFMNDWTPPYSRYWLFTEADGATEKYIHLVVQKANGRFVDIMFGHIDKKGAAYTGGAYLTGTFWNWWFDSGSWNGVYSHDGSNAFDESHRHLMHVENNMNYNVFLGDLDSNRVITNANTANVNRLNKVGISPLNASQSSLGGINRNIGGWLGCIYYLGPLPVNGVTPLFDFPFMWYNTATLRNRFLGNVPDYKICSMIGRLEAEEVTFGSDSYMVFPLKRAIPYIPEPFVEKYVTSGPLGHAYKINIAA